MYVNSDECKILVSSRRPQGRKAFTCSHEIGHHVMGHGARFDELIEDQSLGRNDDPQEYLANSFAAYFLMPKIAIENGLRKRGYAFASLKPEHVYALSSWLGVGYATLVNQIELGLGAITYQEANALRKVTPQSIREKLLDGAHSRHLHIVDQHWEGRAIDCEAGDDLLVPNKTNVEGPSLSVINIGENGMHLRAQKPGISRIASKNSDWSAFVRTSPYEYSGRSCFRFEEEVPD